MRSERQVQAEPEGFFAEFSRRLTKHFQEAIRNSPMWDEMVREFGLGKAEQLLRECRGDVVSGGSDEEIV